MRRPSASSYTLDSGDIGAIVNTPNCPPACPGTLIRTSGGTVLLNDPNDNRIDPDLGQMRLQELVVGLEREIAPKLAVTARYVHKQLDRAVEDVGTREGETDDVTIRIGNPGFGRADDVHSFRRDDTDSDSEGQAQLRCGGGPPRQTSLGLVVGPRVVHVEPA